MGCSNANIESKNISKENKKPVPQNVIREETEKDKKMPIQENDKEEKISNGQKSSNPKVVKKEDFFYCFDEEEIKIIEEKVSNISSYKYNNFIKLYNKFIIDYLNEKDDTIIVKQYKMLYVNEDFNDKSINWSEISNFFLTL